MMESVIPNSPDVPIFPYDTVIILSGGKTGSSTLQKSFKTYSPTSKVCHMHSAIPKYELKGLQLGKRTLIVNSYREPISRMVSSLFQNLHVHVPGLKKEENVIVNKETFIKVKEKMDEWLRNENYIEDYHSVPFSDIVNMEISQDMEQYGFSFVPDNDNDYFPTDYLFMKFEHIKEWEEQISSIFPGFIIVPENITEKKTEYELYVYFKQHYRTDKFQGLLDREENMLIYYNSYEKAKQVAISYIRK